MVEAPLSSSTQIAIAGRKSYLDKVLSVFSSKDVNDFVPIPDYYDAQVKLSHSLGPNESVDVLALTSRDALTRTLADPDPVQDKSDYTLTQFSRVGITYKKAMADGASVLLTPWIGVDHTTTQDSFGGTPTVLDTRSTDFGFRSAYRGLAAKDVVLSVGFDMEGSRSSLSRRGSVTLPAREGDLSVFGQPPSVLENADNWQTTILSVAPYAQADFGFIGDRLHVVPGLRVEPYLNTASRRVPGTYAGDPPLGVTQETTAFDPRISASFQVVPRLSFKAAWGYYHQSPEASDLSAVFGNPLLNVEHGWNALGGDTFKFSDKISLEQVLFYSKSGDLVTRNPSKTPFLAQALVQDGQGRAYGMQVMLRHELSSRFFGWISYTLMRSERKDQPDLPWRLFDFDQTHVATIVGSYDLGRGFEFGARFRYATGFPRTPVASTFSSERRDLYEGLSYGPQNSERIPAFVQVDVRIAKRFEASWGKAEFYLDVQNVTDRENPEEIVYNYNFTRKAYITGLPTLPVLGGKIEW
jgi:hypothetical protein